MFHARGSSAISSHIPQKKNLLFCLRLSFEQAIKNQLNASRVS